MGTLNRERKATIFRQYNTDKDALREGCLRVPIGNRVALSASALTWGALNPDKHDEDTVTLADCIPHSYAAYEAFAPDGENRNHAVRRRNCGYVRPGGKTACGSFFVVLWGGT